MTKTCKACGESKPLSEFYKRKQNSDGRRHKCKVCLCEEQVKKREDDPFAFRKIRQDSSRKCKYGISYEQFQAMWIGQGGSCDICRKPLEFGNGGHAVDHNHDTGKVRGLLCGKCNTAIGLFNDNPSFLDAAASYLREHGDYSHMRN